MDKKSVRALRQSIFSKFTEIEEKMNNNTVNTDVVNITQNILKEDMKYFDKPKTINILYFDDETQNLKKIQKMLKSDYNIFLAHNIDIALDILKKESIDIIMLEHKKNTDVSINFLSNIKKENNLNKKPLFMVLSNKVEKTTCDISNETNAIKYIVGSVDFKGVKQKIQEIYNYRLNKA